LSAYEFDLLIKTFCSDMSCLLQAVTRLQTHFSNVDAVIGYYKNVMVTIDGNRAMDAVFESICNTMDKLKAGTDPMEVFCIDNPAADECRVYE
jgi:adenylate kinase